MERYADSPVAVPIRVSAGRARRASSLRPSAVAPSWIIRGPARKLPASSRLTKPAVSRVRSSRRAVLGGRLVWRAHSVRVTASRVQTSESRANARSTARVELPRVSVALWAVIGAPSWAWEVRVIWPCCSTVQKCVAAPRDYCTMTDASGRLRPEPTVRVAEEALVPTLDGRHLSLDEIVAVARRGEAARVEPAARARVEESHSFADGLAQTRPIYGRSTGVGA